MEMELSKCISSFLDEFLVVHYIVNLRENWYMLLFWFSFSDIYHAIFIIIIIIINNIVIVVVAFQELIAYGSTHMVGSFFLCFPNAAAMSRSAVQDGAGGRTQVRFYLNVQFQIISFATL